MTLKILVLRGLPPPFAIGLRDYSAAFFFCARRFSRRRRWAGVRPYALPSAAVVSAFAPFAAAGRDLPPGLLPPRPYTSMERSGASPIRIGTWSMPWRRW